VVAQGVFEPSALVLAGRKIYWADCVAQAIRRADRDGSEVEDLLSDLTCPTGLAVIEPRPQRPAIVWSEPPDGAIDARQPADIDGSNPAGWTSLELFLDGDPALVSESDFTIETSGDEAPQITAIAVGRAGVTLTFDAPIPPGECIVVRYIPHDTAIRLAALPGDADGNARSSALDILALVDHLNGVPRPPLPDRQCDMNRSGTCDAADILRLIDLLTGAGAYEPWNEAALPACP
jgi:hypothetical protein